MKSVHYFNPGQWPVYIGFTTSPKAFAREIKRMKIEGDYALYKPNLTR